MLKWFIRKRLTAFEREYGYDMSYVRELLAIDTAAFFAFAKVQSMSRYRKDVPAHVAFAVGITGTIAEDCGPCTQLGVTMALEQGISARTIATILGGDVAMMSDELALGVKFARAVLAHDVAADELRADIVRRWGPRALVSLSFALTLSRFWPTLKYALGHGKACARVMVEGEPIVVRGAA